MIRVRHIVCFLFCWQLAACASQPAFTNSYYAFNLSPHSPHFTWFTVDGLGRGQFGNNAVIDEAGPTNKLSLERSRSGGLKSRVFGQKEYFAYRMAGAPAEQAPIWQVEFDDSEIVLRSEYFKGMSELPMTLTFDQKANHATLLGVIKNGDRRMPLPCVLHLPDQGSVRITSNQGEASLGYDARRYVPKPFVRVEFPAASPAMKKVEYRLKVSSIYPELKEIKGDARYDGFRRGFLNIFQVNPRLQMLANNASSDPCTFTLYKYSEVARRAPPLVGDLTCLDLVRMTLDQYISGKKGYGQPGYAAGTVDADLIPWPTPHTTLDSLPSLIIAACNYAEGAEDWKWARANYPRLLEWASEMIRHDKSGNGIMEYPRSGNYGDRPVREMRPANWWDTINFGHEDAYSNALIYHACQRFSALARQLDKPQDADVFTLAAGKLAVAYVPNFINPDTGILAGWRSADGRLHDYWFLFVNSVAISYGLVDPPTANAIMDRFMKKMQEVGYTNFGLGLPGNLVPIRKGDYVSHGSAPDVHGEPTLEDGSDGFQYYENGGATGCFAWFTVRALYRLGRVEDARKILYPMLDSYAAGNFQGFCADSTLSKDWRDWKGGCHGYEGLLVDNYLALLAVFDDAAAKVKNK